MSEIIGDLRRPRDEAEIESLTLRFSPGSKPIQQRWRNNGLSADFMADYVATFFPRVEDDPVSEQRRIEVSGAVKYIANELLENAMKYSVSGAAQPISIMLQLDHDRIDFWLVNTANSDDGREMRRFIERLRGGEPEALYMEQLERSATEEGSGLGLLTMVNDYEAGLAWEFAPGAAEETVITTHVYLAI